MTTAPVTTTVHILTEGRALCGMPGLPGDWPRGHVWVRINDPDAPKNANCAECLARLGGAIPAKEIYTRATEGKYDAEASALADVLRAEAVLVVVKQGALGDGFSVAIDSRKATVQKIIGEIPRVLRAVADAIEREEPEKSEVLQ